MLSILVILASLTAAARAGDSSPPTDWIRRWNDAWVFPYRSTEVYEKIAELMEANDYLRYHEIALSKIYDKTASPFSPLPIERAAVYSWILRQRIIEYEEARAAHSSDLERAKENVAVAYRRLSRCEYLPLWSRTMLLRGAEIADGSWNIGWTAPVPPGKNYIWRFYLGGVPSGAVLVDRLGELYHVQTGFRYAGQGLFQMLGLFTLRIWSVTNSEKDVELEMLKQALSVEIRDPATGFSIDLPILRKIAKEEAEKIYQETQAAQQ